MIFSATFFFIIHNHSGKFKCWWCHLLIIYDRKELQYINDRGYIKKKDLSNEKNCLEKNQLNMVKVLWGVYKG